MSSAVQFSTPSSYQRRSASRLVVVALLCTLALTVLGGSAAATASTGVTPTGGDGGASQTVGTPGPTPTNYDSEIGGPHPDTPEEATGRAVSTGTVVFMVAVVAVTAAIIVALAVRARRKRAAGAGDLQ